VVAVDATGWIQSLYPPAGVAPLVPAGQVVLLPDEAHWFGLDEQKGYEHVYFMASYDRQPQLEGSVARLAGRERNLPANPQPVAEPVILESAWIEARGTTAVGPAAPRLVQTRDAADYRVAPTTFSFGVPGRDFVLTRTFEHR